MTSSQELLVCHTMSVVSDIAKLMDFDEQARWAGIQEPLVLSELNPVMVIL